MTPVGARRGVGSVLLVAITALSGCGDVDEGVVARVDGWTLEAGALADLLVLAQPYPLDLDGARALARQWVGVAAFARAVERGDALEGPEATAESMWLERREALLALDREDRLGARAALDPEPAFHNGTYRLFAHVLRRVAPETSPAERALQRRSAERMLQELVSGGSWDAAVAQSEDVATRETSGLLGLFARGELPPPLDAVAFRLEPGQVSSVVETAQGFHILYRPRYVDVAGLYAARLRERWLAEADREATAGLLEARGLVVEEHALNTVRAIADEPMVRLGSDRIVARWEGGVLEEGGLARYLAALPPESRVELSEGPAEGVRMLIEEVSIRQLRLDDARARGLALAPEDEARYREQHVAEVRAWTDALGLGAEVDAREALRRYMDDLVARRAEPRALAPLFEAWLLGRVEWSVHEPGLERSLEMARGMVDGAG